MYFREANINDIKQIQFVRHAVKENRLSNPDLVTDRDVEIYLTKRGKGWVCEKDQVIVGFAIVDLVDENVWALFVLPDFEAKGIGKNLHQTMLEWYFQQNKNQIWLSTEPASRAELFYRLQGWRETGNYGAGEIKFELTAAEWKKFVV